MTHGQDDDGLSRHAVPGDVACRAEGDEKLANVGLFWID
jgi:hypothetical protein